MLRLGGVLVLAMVALGTAAQAPSLVGTVIAEDHQPVAGALVYIVNAQRIGLTDASGRFELPAPPSEDVLTISAEGHARASFAVDATDAGHTYVLTRVDEPTWMSPPFGDDLRFPLAASHLQMPVGDSIRSIPFHVASGANGGSFEASWVPTQEIRSRFTVSVVHVASNTTFGGLDEDPPLRYPLGGAMLRDFPGAYRLDVELRDGNAVGDVVHVEGFVTGGPWIAKLVQGKAPEVLDPLDDETLNQRMNQNMDITAIRFTNETDEQLDVEMELAQLTDTAARPGVHAFWSVHWSYGDTQWAVFMRGAEEDGPRWYAGTCDDERPLLCELQHRLYGTLETEPPRVRWHVPKRIIGNASDATAIEAPRGLTFEIPTQYPAPFPAPLLMAQAIESDNTTAELSRPYTLGANQYAIPAEAVQRLVAPSLPGAALAVGFPVLGLVAVAVAMAGGALAWRRRKARVEGRYHHLRVLGQGSSGRTSLARDRVSRQLVAIKQCSASSNSPTVRARLVREARIGSRIAHPNVVRVLDIDERSHSDAIIMEFLPGGSLEARLASGPLPREEALLLWRDILAGLEAIHAAGIVHRDVKPSNVLLTEEGRAKVADFGVARSVAEETLGPDGPVGTPLYMAPEVLQGRDPTLASDLYSATAVAYRMLTGRPHLDVAGGDAWAALLERRGRRAALPLTGLPAWLNELLAQGLAEDPRKRPTSAAAMLRVLEPHLPRPAKTRPPLPPP